jgi:hypothetical protein
MSGLVAVISNGEEAAKKYIYDETWAGLSARYNRQSPGEIKLDEHGRAEFTVNGGSVSVWIADVAAK